MFGSCLTLVISHGAFTESARMSAMQKIPVDTSAAFHAASAKETPFHNQDTQVRQSSPVGGRPLGGGFVAAWTPQTDFNVRIFQADGSAILPRFSTDNDDTNDPGLKPVVVGVLQNGRFVVASLTQTPGTLAGQIFERNGSPVARVQIRDESGRLERNLAGALLAARA